MACSTSCLTQDHASWGECVRSKNLKSAVSIPGKGWDRATQSAWDKRIGSYRAAREQGIQPAGSTQGHIDAAVKASDATGTAFVAS